MFSLKKIGNLYALFYFATLRMEFSYSATEIAREKRFHMFHRFLTFQWNECIDQIDTQYTSLDNGKNY